MALALYRKYRPATFAEVVGQEHVTDPLRTALTAGRINHAYLFSGPRGCGKTSSARIMARSLNCVQGPTPDPCGECHSCVALAPEGSGSVDVTELDAASHGGVDDARELRDRAFYAPADSRYRVFIIDEAHMVTTQGFNALLKIVEEPPEHVIFIFATTEPEKVLPTIRSRTHHYPFRLIPPGAMRALLERNVAAEGAIVEPAVYPLVIRAGGGSARDTQSVLDQLLAGAGPEGISYSRAVALLGVTDVALIDDMVDGLAADDAAAVFGTIERLSEAGHDPRRFTTDLLDRLRDLVLLRSVPEAANKGLVSAPEEELGRMLTQAEHSGLGTLSRYADIVHNGLLEMRGATSARLVLELLCARMLLPAATEGEAALLHRLERVERRIAAGNQPTGEAVPVRPTAAGSVPTTPNTAAPVSTPVTPPKEFRRAAVPVAPIAPAASTPPPAAISREAESAPTTPPQTQQAAPTQPATVAQPDVVAEAPIAPQEPVPAQPAEESQPIGALDAVAVRRIWTELLDLLRKTPGTRSTGAMLAHATVHSVEGTTVVLSHSAEPLARRLSEQHNSEKIAAALQEILGGQWQVRCVHSGTIPATATQQAAAQSAAPAQRSFQRPSADVGKKPVAPKPVEAAKPFEPSPPPLPEPPDEEPPPEPADLASADIASASQAAAPSEEFETGPDSPESLESSESSVAEAATSPTEIAHKLLTEHLGARLLN